MSINYDEFDINKINDKKLKKLLEERDKHIEKKLIFQI